MALYRVTPDTFERVQETTFAAENLKERSDIQRLLRADISILSTELMVVSEEFGDWVESNRRIDLLCLDTEANVVVVELKRSDDGGHMELQAVRYAAMVSSMTFDQLVNTHARMLGGPDAAQKSEAALLDFLSWESSSDGTLSGRVRIMLVSANFSTELTTAVIWLNKQGLDVSCFRMKPHRLGSEVLIDIQQIIPLPEAADYEVKLRAQLQEAQRVESARGAIFRRFWAQLIDRSKARTNVVAGRSTSSDNWLNGSIGKTGFSPTFTMKQHDSRVEMYIDLGKGNEQRTKAAFHSLLVHREAIEQSYAGKLEWQLLPDKRGCRIYAVVDGGWKTHESDWVDLQDRLVDAMARLENAFKAPLTIISV